MTQVHDLFPSVLPHSRPLIVLGVRRRGAEFVEHAVRSVMNPPESTGMGFWSINPYVGCEFGCSYCYARYAHHYAAERAGVVDASEPVDPFERRILVKDRSQVLAALERDLARVRARARDAEPSIVIGTATDPYQPAERSYRVTRAVLERLRSEHGFNIGVITKSPLVTRDVDVLGELAGRHRVNIYVSLISVDVRLIKLFEARSPMPHARLRALRRLSGAGIRAGLIVAPVLPGITDTVPQINALMAAGREAGARFVYPSVLRLYADPRERFLPLVRQHFPELAPRYEAAYGRGRDAPRAYVEALNRRFRRIARRFGIPETDGEREQPATRAAVRQLNLWGQQTRNAER